MIDKSTSSDRKSGTTTDLRRELLGIETSLAHGFSKAGMDFRNAFRRMRKTRLDYVVLSVGGPLPERDGPPRGFIERRLPLPGHPPSLQQLNARLLAVADADNARGVVFVFRGFTARLATLQNFRAAVTRLRAAGKEAIVYTPYLDLSHYYAATAANQIIAPPGAHFEVLGLFTEVTFFKDSLSRVGLEAEVVQISPYKTAMDRFSRAGITPEYREQLNWLLDDQFDMVVSDMAADRGMDQTHMRQIIDRGPLSVEVAQTAGLVDQVAFDDELADLLSAGETTSRSDASHPRAADDLKSSRGARLKTWAGARMQLMEKPRRRTKRFVGVVSLEGLITMGPSRQPPIELPIPLIGGASAGEQTLVGILRRIEKLDDMAAVVLHVDSGGGSALASALIGRQIDLLSARKPVVVYMGDIAASGGYYVAATARHIMSQRATLTGSIGVIMSRLSSSGLYDKLAINRTTLERGEHAGLYRDSDPMSAEERAIFWRTINEIYDQFKGVVARGRNMDLENVDEIGGGRVWTGRQALNLGLVDSHGDFLEAIKKAAELAALPTNDVHAVSVINLFPKNSEYTIYPSRAKQVVEDLAGLLSGEQFQSLNGRPLMLLPYDLRLR